MGKRKNGTAGYEMVRIIKTVSAIIIGILFLFSASMSNNPCAQMIVIDDERLSDISAQASIWINIGDSGARYTADVIKFSDTDSDPAHWIEFKDFVIDDGAGGSYSFDTSGGTHFFSGNFMTIEVGTGVTAPGQTTVVIHDSRNYHPRYYSVGSLIFCDQSLGSLDIDGMTQHDSRIRVGGHADGTHGIDFDYTSKMYIDDFKFTYNTAGSALSFSKINLVEDATVITGDDPSDPTTWDLSDISVVGKFKIGDMENGSPGTIDVATGSDDKSFVLYNVPMQGCIRVDDVTFGSKDFGPCAIDGIDVKHLYIQLKPE